jgi:hypothetical protein
MTWFARRYDGDDELAEERPCTDTDAARVVPHATRYGSTPLTSAQVAALSLDVDYEWMLDFEMALPG